MGKGKQQRDAGAVKSKPYASPQLVEYGRVADLIAGGSTPDKNEGGGGMEKKPT
jgi:hypothetical protein